MRIAASPRVEERDRTELIRPVVVEHPVHMADRPRPTEPPDAVVVVGLIVGTVAGVVVGELIAPIDVPGLPENASSSADRRPVVVAGIGLGPLVRLLGPVPQPACGVELLVEDRHAARPAEANAGSLCTLVVEVPPLLRIRLAAGLEADAVPSTDSGQRAGAATRDEVLAGLLVQLGIPVDTDDHGPPSRLLLIGQRGQGVLLDVGKVVRDQAPKARVVRVAIHRSITHQQAPPSPRAGPRDSLPLGSRMQARRDPVRAATGRSLMSTLR